MKMKKLVSALLAGVMAVSMAAPAMATTAPDTAISDAAELKAALEAGGTYELDSNITVGLDTPMSTAGWLYTTKDIEIDGKGYTITIDDSSKNGFTIAGATSTLQNLTIVGGKSVLQIYAGTATLENVTLKNGAGAGLLVNNGAEVTATNLTTSGNSWGGVNVDPNTAGTAKFELISGSIGDEPAIYVDADDKDKVDDGSITITPPSDWGEPTVDENGNPVWNKPITPDPKPPVDNDRDDRDESDPWEDVLDEIAALDEEEIEEGETLKFSGAGMDNVPRRVLRSIKGRDITLEIRKNGETYRINGLDIGDLDKLWYDFDNLDTIYATADKDDAAATKPVQETGKQNPDTGR